MTYKSKMIFFTTLNCFLELDLADILRFDHNSASECMHMLCDS